MHRSSMTQELWRLRFGSDAPIAPNDDGTRVPSQARVSVRYDMLRDLSLRSRYESAFGTMRLGVLLEDMDALAGSVAWRHAAEPDTPAPMLVTASVEEIQVHRPLPLDGDYKCTGEVVWAGTSSLVIIVEMVLSGDVVVKGIFTYVARKRDGSGAAKVFPLVPETEEEKLRFQEIDEKQKALKEKRIASKQNMNSKNDSDDDDQRKRKLIDSLLDASRRNRDFPGLVEDGLVAMSQTRLLSAQMCHPQDRNTAGNVFGGVLLRRALEHAFATAFTFAGKEPRMAAIQRVDFLKPVHVGSLLALSSIITFTENPPPGHTEAFVHVSVRASTWMPQTTTSILNNTFAFLFCIDKPTRRLKQVFPNLRTEAELVVEAKPRYHNKTS